MTLLRLCTVGAGRSSLTHSPHSLIYRLSRSRAHPAVVLSFVPVLKSPRAKHTHTQVARHARDKTITTRATDRSKMLNVKSYNSSKENYNHSSLQNHIQISTFRYKIRKRPLSFTCVSTSRYKIRNRPLSFTRVSTSPYKIRNRPLSCTCVSTSC